MYVQDDLNKFVIWEGPECVLEVQRFSENSYRALAFKKLFHSRTKRMSLIFTTAMYFEPKKMLKYLASLNTKPTDKQLIISGD